ncbi:MAG: sigma-70 family RNA polymerase sigma factor [Verrucomicrobiaceae bacterium]|nr:sigma-70 family RNA polymerase sigma factor [Verrucomicrobiaceae bacterium]
MDPAHTHNATFPETPWTHVRLAGGEDTMAQSSLETFCRMYWAPLYAYARRQGMIAVEAEDVTQSFFVHLLENWPLSAADRDKGRLRSYLLGGLKNFMLNWHRAKNTVQRGGRWQRVEFDTQEVEAVCAAQSAGLSPEECFERQWAASLFDHALRDLEAEMTAAGKGQQFAVLSEFLLVHGKEARHSEAAAQLGMAEGTVRVAVLRLRQRFRDRVRAHVAATVNDEAEVDLELRHLMNLYSGSD